MAKKKLCRHVKGTRYFTVPIIAFILLTWTAASTNSSTTSSQTGKCSVLRQEGPDDSMCLNALRGYRQLSSCSPGASERWEWTTPARRRRRRRCCDVLAMTGCEDCPSPVQHSHFTTPNSCNSACDINFFRLSLSVCLECSTCASDEVQRRECQEGGESNNRLCAKITTTTAITTTTTTITTITTTTTATTTTTITTRTTTTTTTITTTATTTTTITTRTSITALSTTTETSPMQTSTTAVSTTTQTNTTEVSSLTQASITSIPTMPMVQATVTTASCCVALMLVCCAACFFDRCVGTTCSFAIPRGKDCYSPRTLFQKSVTEYITYEELKKGCRVLDCHGRQVEVLEDATVYEAALLSWVTLKTRSGATLDVTECHRFAMPDEEGNLTCTIRAHELTKGDCVPIVNFAQTATGVRCAGYHLEPLTKIGRHKMSKSFVKVRFTGDAAVPCFLLPGAAMVSRGEELPPTTGADRDSEESLRTPDSYD